MLFGFLSDLCPLYSSQNSYSPGRNIRQSVLIQVRHGGGDTHTQTHVHTMHGIAEVVYYSQAMREEGCSQGRYEGIMGNVLS